jgi:DNA repair protein RecN (Recombination protein N)
VTHLPQVAAQGDRQWTVVKAGSRSKLAVNVRQLEGAARVEELARMLGGAQITATTRRHAAEMLGG